MPVTMPAGPDMHGQPAQSRRLDHIPPRLSMDTLIHETVRTGGVILQYLLLVWRVEVTGYCDEITKEQNELSFDLHIGYAT